jgi:hypothetical protein
MVLSEINRLKPTKEKRKINLEVKNGLPISYFI